MSNTEYFSRVERLAFEVVSIMKEKGYSLSFGGEGEIKKRIYPPTDARSEFLANRALGDWAEKTLASAIRLVEPGLGIAHYGQSDSISAGEEGFKEFYEMQIEIVRKFGKRPDLLLFHNPAVVEGYSDFDISMQPFENLDEITRLAFSSIEVRSSKVDALTYMAVRKQDRETKKVKSSTRDTPSFTMKIEDLVIVYRWLQRYKLPQTYCQVFFDSVWAMDFSDMLDWITKNNFKIDNPDKSQGKATILIPITAGTQIGKFKFRPKQEIHQKITRLGRHDSYIEPIFDENNLELDVAALKKVILY